MKKMMAALTLAMTMMFFIPVATMAGNLEPSAAPDSTMKTLDEIEPRIPISAVPYTITTSGHYYFTGDLTSATSGITVSASNVTIDLMGYSLIGPANGSDDGINIDNEETNVEIRNGTVRNFDLGIHTYNMSTHTGGHRIINIRAVSNGNVGIDMSNGKNILIKDCTAGNNGDRGIKAGYGCTITGNVVHNNAGQGIYGASGNTITGNTSYENGSSGIGAANGNTITGNTAYDNVHTGITTGGGCTITGNTTYKNGTSGITTTGGSAITGNTSRSNQESGINPGGDSLLDQNNASNNNQGGGGFANIDVCATCTWGLNKM